ncbi:GntR family transcriptional regulator [Nonomuraea typhae]|uniref:GntR family transcriptional regulator n=1 Tax=Nonomuraea typhae TaxID=2603600 RepID=UPI0012F8C125|nr:GntR family transcriptional regulator [Nonomuraea typhae]
MPEPAYVRIAGEYARRIRGGQLPPRVQLPSHKEIAQEQGVSEIVVRKALDLLQSQGLVRSVPRRGIFVADRPNLVRVSPERQMESAESTFGTESDRDVRVIRETEQIPASEDLAEALGIPEGELITHVITRASEDGRPISISDTYHPVEVTDISGAAHLEEILADQLPTSSHAEWLRTAHGEIVKTVHQRFLADDGRIIMVSDVSYPRDRYDRYVFRMNLK